MTSFKKIHVPIRLAHRRSFNEQINHSDGYNGVITGFKYDHLHPNGAAEPWLKAKKKKKGRQNWGEFHFVLYLDPFERQETLSGAEGQIWKDHHNSAPTITSPRSRMHWLLEALTGVCGFEVERFCISYFLSCSAFPS